MLSIIQKSSTAPTVMKAFLQNGIFSASTGANKNPPSVGELFHLKNQDLWWGTPRMIPNLKADYFIIPKNQRLEPKIEGGWKMFVRFKGVILRFQLLVFRSVPIKAFTNFLIHPDVSTTFKLSTNGWALFPHQGGALIPMISWCLKSMPNGSLQSPWK